MLNHSILVSSNTTIMASKKKTAPKKTAAKKTAAKKISKKTAAKKDGAPKPKLTLFQQKQYKRLLELRDGLIDSTHGLTKDTLLNNDGSDLSGSGEHAGDAGSDAYDRDLALNILSKEQDALYEIEQAIRRVENGKYGICEISGEKIPKERLEAIPFCRLTVQQQSKWEERFGKERYRRSDEPGYKGEIDW